MKTTRILLAAMLIAAGPARPQEAVWGDGSADARLEAMASWVALDVATGYEMRTTPEVAAAIPGWEADRWGNVVARVGSGAPRRIVACQLDAPAYTASQITDDGYLRVHRIGSGSRHPLWDQAFEAQQVRILTATGPVAGVVGRSNGHFAQQHRDERTPATADDLWVDVGATTAGEVTALGIGLLDPIVRHLPPWTFADEVAGPSAGARVGCAAVATLAAAARNGPAPAGETHFVLSAQGGMGLVGLSSYIARHGAFDEVVLLGPGAAERVSGDLAAGSLGRLGRVLEGTGVSSVAWLAAQVRSPGSHMEAVRLDEALALLEAGAEAAGIEIEADARWVEAPARAPLRTDHMDPALQDVASLLTDLVELHAVSSHEWPVRRYVLEALPDWARERALVDDVGNVWVAAGPDRDTTVFMAHMDEVGYQIDSIAPDGVVTLERAGGPVSSAWEGQTALLHFDPEGAPSTRTGEGDDTDPRWKRESLAADAPPPLRGVFLTRDEAEERNPGTLTAWFGVDRAALEARGVRVGMGVTSHKEGLRLGTTRFVARALDDRAGTSALLLAIRSVDPDRLPGKVIFAWSVYEEGGLEGAAALARRFGTTTRRIYSVDTFVSSDTPLESPHFAYAPLGRGPVLRAIENSSVSPDAARARVMRVAREAGIPLQMGLTQGGTDGTEFTFFGAPNQGLSWPGRYSHSPGEVLDLRDLERLADLIGALATAGETR